MRSNDSLSKEISAEHSSLIAELEGCLEPGNVVVDKAAVEKATRTCIPYRELPLAVVYPTSVEQVQRVVRIAGKHDVPIWPVSTGKNWGYGGKTATYPGGITMILEKMTKICHVDEELGYAVVEPGVTFRQLNDDLKAHHPSLWSDSPGTTQYASVIGNALDKGRGLTPYADHYAHMCGMDVVLPDGSILETGGGPVGNNHVRHLYRNGIGPNIEALFAQSNFGIVVRAGIWLMPAPECFDWASFEYTASQDRFGPFVDDLRKLVFQGALRSRPHVANDFAMMCIVSQYPHERLNGGRRLSEAAMHAWRREHGVEAWTFGFGLYGSRLEVKFQKQALKSVLGRYGRLTFAGVAAEDSVRGRVVREAAPLLSRLRGQSAGVAQSLMPAIDLYRGIPTDHFVRQVYFKSHARKPDSDIDAARDECGFIWLGPMVPFSSKHVLRGLDLAKKIYERHEFDFFVELIIESPRAIIFLLGAFYDRNDEADAARARAWYEEIRQSFLDHGYPTYRSTTISMPSSADVNPVSRNFVNALKGAVDRTNLIAPGRYGISAPRDKIRVPNIA